ncbi:MAG TPA: MOSC N-terminal beta barrel domain-containing protein, partial [Candidatus Polarisedimenticolia bacterium]|nr:MOSC N-terminal beta barrel domain-containing protein [Candidatus Polarisedimenticolia bacterium]
MVISELWRYPVKSMAGEPLRAADLGPDGIRGDRLVQVRDGRGGIITSRTHPRLLGLRATLGDDG